MRRAVVEWSMSVRCRSPRLRSHSCFVSILGTPCLDGPGCSGFCCSSRHTRTRLRSANRDDGQSIAGAVLDCARPGHFGVSGMRERAELIGGHFEVWSEAGMGTEVALTLPGAVVYVTLPGRRDFWSFGGRRKANS